METHVEFRSALFPPYEGEEEEINPGRYGKRLAEFLKRGLTGKGFEVGEPFAEDWGWVVPITNTGFSMWIGCGNYDEYPDDGFLCFIEPHTPTIRRWFRKIDTSRHVAALREAVGDLLANEPGVRGRKWWTYEEFMHPGKAGTTQ